MNSIPNKEVLEHAPQTKKRGEKASKPVAHILGIFEHLRRRECPESRYVAHLMEEREVGEGREGEGGSGDVCDSGIDAAFLSEGVGLVLYWINQKKKQKISTGDDWFVYLSSRFADQLCPRQRKGKTIVKHLVDFGVLIPFCPHVIGFTPAHYRIHKDWVGIFPKKLTEWQRLRLDKARTWKHACDCKECPALAWIEKSLARITLPETEILREAMQDPRTERSAREAMRYLRGYIPIHERPVTRVGYAGTFYTPIMSLPRRVVPTLLIDGEPVSQLDITSAHPCTIPSLLIEAEQKYKVAGGLEEARRLAIKLESGQFYDQLASQLGIDPKLAKKRFLAALNGENRHTYNEAVFQKFAEMFPVAKEVIAKIRRSDRKRLNAKMASLLARVINYAIETCAKLQIPVYPRTDEIVCRQRDEALVREILSAYFLDQTSVRARIGGEMVTFLPKEGAQCAESFSTLGMPRSAALHAC